MKEIGAQHRNGHPDPFLTEQAGKAATHFVTAAPLATSFVDDLAETAAHLDSSPAIE